MHLLVYASPFNVVGRSLRKKIQSLGTGIRSTHFSSIKSLDRHLRRPLGATSICILMPSDSGELAALIGIRHLLRDLRVILILNDEKACDMPAASAHMLRPRFIGYTNGDLTDVTAVLSKMMAADCQNPIHAIQ